MTELTSSPYVFLGVVASLIFCINHFFGIKKDSSEPLFVPSTIPYFGHLIGLVVNKTSYYAKLRYVWTLSGKEVDFT